MNPWISGTHWPRLKRITSVDGNTLSSPLVIRDIRIIRDIGVIWVIKNIGVMRVMRVRVFGYIYML